MSAGRDLARLDEISRELAAFGPEYERAVGEAVRAEWDYRKAEAAALLLAKGPNAGAREAAAIQSLVSDGWFDRRAVCEAKRRAMEARFRVWESEKSALQTKLKVERLELEVG